MNCSSKSMVRSNVLILLLGDCKDSHVLSLKIFKKCKITPYICDWKKSFLSFVSPFSRYFSLVSSERDLLFDSLDYIASHRDFLPVIVPCNQYFFDFLEENREFLESRFIISGKDSLFSSLPLSIF